jgi:hypothetical protein
MRLDTVEGPTAVGEETLTEGDAGDIKDDEYTELETRLDRLDALG